MSEAHAPILFSNGKTIRFPNGNMGQLLTVRAGQTYSLNITCRGQLISLESLSAPGNKVRKVELTYCDPMQHQLPQVQVTLSSCADGVYIPPFANVNITSDVGVVLVVERWGTKGEMRNGINPLEERSHGASGIYKLLSDEQIRVNRPPLLRPETPAIDGGRPQLS